MEDAAAAPDFYFEDFPVGHTATFGDYLVTREEVVAFAEQFDPQPFHLDEAEGRKTLLGGLAASGWHTAAMGMRMVADGLLARSSCMGAPGIDEVRWLVPVRPGDRLRMKARVTGARVSASRPTIGLVTVEMAMLNQKGDTVYTQSNALMFGRRPESNAA